MSRELHLVDYANSELCSEYVGSTHILSFVLNDRLKLTKTSFSTDRFYGSHMILWSHIFKFENKLWSLGVISGEYGGWGSNFQMNSFNFFFFKAALFWRKRIFSLPYSSWFRHSSDQVLFFVAFFTIFKIVCRCV